METIKCKNLIHFFKININCASVTEIVMGPTVVTFPLEFSSKTPHHEYNTKFIIHMISTKIPYSRVTCNITQMDCVCEDSVIKSDLRVVFTVNQQWICLNEVYVRLRFGVLRACSHLPHPYSLSNRDKECRLFSQHPVHPWPWYLGSTRMGGRILCVLWASDTQGPELAVLGMTSARPAGRRSRVGGDNPGRLLEVETCGPVLRVAKKAANKTRKLCPLFTFVNCYSTARCPLKIKSLSELFKSGSSEKQFVLRSF